ncbi:MAG: serine/threonine-protein kinase [Planctomycetota bacterium]
MAQESLAGRCPTCGTGLETSGECNVCLLQLGIGDPTSDFVGESSLPSVEELNAQFPQLEVKRLIGRGGMGAVYHARQTSLDRDVALKVIHKKVSSDAAFVERFAREAKTLAKLSHPNIVTIFDFGQSPDGTAYLVLEYVDGIHLREAISGGSIGADEALEVVSKICGALEYAHSKGVVHRDIKPENILLGEDGTLKVADFGIAKIVDDSVRVPTLTATRQVLGSLHYLAPEHLEAPEQVDHRVDLYALGVIFYELLTGQLPLGRYEAPSKVQHRVDHRLDSIVMKTLSRKPDQRYQRASELDSELDQFAAQTRESRSGGDGAEAPWRASFMDHSSVSVPFTCEADDGMSSAIGVIHVREDCFFAEFRIKNAFGILKSKTHVIQIPRSNLSRLELVPGFLGSKLIVSSQTLSALGDLPNAETGRVQLSIKRNDEAHAREITHALGFDSIQSVPRQPAGGPIDWPDQPSDSVRHVYGTMMILCGILNGGTLAICEYLFVRQLDGFALVPAIISAALLMGPLAALQIVTGILNLVGRVRSLSLTTCIISMVLITPVWILAFPISVWAFRAFKKGATTDTPTPGKKQTWGATTMMFIRESRWAKVTGVVSTAAAVILLAGLGAFEFGYYPVQMNYRVVNANIQGETLDRALQGRLQTFDGFLGIDYDSTDQPTAFTIKTWRCSRDQVEDLLRVQQVPKLVWLIESESVKESTNIPLVPGLDASQFRTVQESLGTALVVSGDSLELTPELVAKVSTSGEGNQVIVELTAVGRQQLAKQRGANSTAGLGLVIEGLVEGIASTELITQKTITFQLSDASEHNPRSIESGIRGPSLPTTLELLRSGFWKQRME